MLSRKLLDEKTSQEESAIIENILQNYRKNVIFEITDAGAIKITVHTLFLKEPQNTLIT